MIIKLNSARYGPAFSGPALLLGLLVSLAAIGAPAQEAPRAGSPPGSEGIAGSGPIAGEGGGTSRKGSIKFTRGPAGSGAVALTFDDGPDARLTPKLLGILKEKNVSATFFLLGERVDLFPSVAKAIAEAGFEIGNHTYTHNDLTQLSIEDVRLEIRRTQEAIEKVTGNRPKLFRPPYGKTNQAVEVVAREEGLDIVVWSVDPRDWSSGMTSSRIVEKIKAEAGGGAIVLLHDIHKRTINAVAEIIEAVDAKDLEFTTAGRMVALEKEARARGVVSGPAATRNAPAGSKDPDQPARIPLGKSSHRRYKEKRI